MALQLVDKVNMRSHDRTEGKDVAIHAPILGVLKLDPTIDIHSPRDELFHGLRLRRDHRNRWIGWRLCHARSLTPGRHLPGSRRRAQFGKNVIAAPTYKARPA